MNANRFFFDLLKPASFPGSSVSSSFCERVNKKETKYPDNEDKVGQKNKFSLKLALLKCLEKIYKYILDLIPLPRTEILRHKNISVDVHKTIKFPHHVFLILSTSTGLAIKICGAFLDIGKAFDKVQNQGLIYKLR